MKTTCCGILFIIALLCVAIQGKLMTSVTPQMGWNSWNKFACDISESLIKETANALVSTGLAALGYKYINIDDCWQSDARDSEGNIQADTTRFPSGMKSLSDYVHGRRLKFGIYSSAGFKTCQGYPASLGLEDVDAQQYSNWGVDYLKYDNCYQEHAIPKKRFSAMADAIEKVDQEIFYSLCEWGRENPAVWGAEIGANSWRISGDITDEWKSIISRAEIGASLWRYAGPGQGWNDPDMLEIGNGHCSTDEYQTHFSLWAILKAPLIIGNDIRNMDTSSDIFSILSNKEVIAVNQDTLGAAGRIIYSDVSNDLLPKYGFGKKLIATKCSEGASSPFQDDIKNQQWVYENDGTIRNVATNQCLHEMSLSFNSQVESIGLPQFNLSSPIHSVSTADCSVATKWDLGGKFIGGQVVSKDTGKCLEVEKFELYPESQGKRIQTAPCQDFSVKNRNEFMDIREHQSWTFPHKSTLLNLYQRQCLTVDEDAYSGVFHELWKSEMSDGSVVLLIVNKSDYEGKFTLTTDVAQLSKDKKYTLRDLWKHSNLVQKLSDSNSVDFLIKSHASVMLKVKVDQ